LNYSEEEKAYALYFLTVTAVEIGVESPMKYFLDNYDIAELPINISIALKADFDSDDKFSKLSMSKSYNKKIKKLMKGNKKLVDKIKYIIDTPIKDSS
ncbi:MAG: hypothetical protein RI563_10570, partial [Thiohalophilus sp.]|uniref:hypothetical protein n=1 Tax=Thiohalophilus sp. TaxID=3028392 RepID=UPI00286FE8E4